MSNIPNIFTLDYTPCGAPIFECDISTWAGSGYPDPLSGRPCDMDAMTFENRKDENGEIKYWMSASNVSGSFMRLFND